MQHEDQSRNEAKETHLPSSVGMALALTTCYPAFLITVEVPYVHLYASILGNRHQTQIILSIQDRQEKRMLYHSSVNLVILEKSSKSQMLLLIIYTNRGEPLHPSSISVSVARYLDLAYPIDNMEFKDNKNKLSLLRFSKISSLLPCTSVKSISNEKTEMFMHTARDDSLLCTMRFVSRHAGTQVYGAILPQAMTNQALLDSESPSKKKSTKDKKVAAPKPKPTKKKTLFKVDRGKGLNVLSEVALSEAAQLKEATKRSKKDFHISQASGSGDGNDFE
ncbi:hypothetical protein Tco_1352609 [Tanacetum coccineum]